MITEIEKVRVVYWPLTPINSGIGRYGWRITTMNRETTYAEGTAATLTLARASVTAWIEREEMKITFG